MLTSRASTPGVASPGSFGASPAGDGRSGVAAFGAAPVDGGLGVTVGPEPGDAEPEGAEPVGVGPVGAGPVGAGGIGRAALRADVTSGDGSDVFVRQTRNGTP